MGPDAAGGGELAERRMAEPETDKTHRVCLEASQRTMTGIWFGGLMKAAD